MSIRDIIDRGCYDAADAANAVLAEVSIDKEMDGGALFMIVSHNDCDYDLAHYIDGYIPRDHEARGRMWASMQAALLAVDEWFDDFIDSGSATPTPPVPFEVDEDFGPLRMFRVQALFEEYHEADVRARSMREALHVAKYDLDDQADWNPHKHGGPIPVSDSYEIAEGYEKGWPLDDEDAGES